jgi:hypothetical protein
MKEIENGREINVINICIQISILVAKNTLFFKVNV